MDRAEALAKMVPPGQRRPGKWMEGVIQICVTSSCDKSCFNCTQGSNYRRKPWFMSLENFENACISLKDYFGVVGVFGGNPAIHPQFDQLCAILSKHIPPHRRGLWCNNPLGKGRIMHQTFNPNVSNLNVHLDADAYREFKETWPGSMPFGLHEDSRHSPVFTSMDKLIPDEETRWNLIANCDINQHWSAMIGQFRGELRAWFCEIAGAQSMLMQDNPDYPDTGLLCGLDYYKYPTRLEGKCYWWQLPMSAFGEQVDQHCHKCGVPLRGYGELAQGETGKEQVTEDYANYCQSKKKDRPVEVVTTLEELKSKGLKFTHYIQGAKQ